MRCTSVHGFILVLSIAASASSIRVRRIDGPWQLGGGSLQQPAAVVNARAAVARRMAQTAAAHKEAEREKAARARVAQGKGGTLDPGRSLPGTVNNGDRLFIAKIHMHATKDELEALFSRFGQLTDIFLPSGEYPAGHKGICFLSYTDATAANLAISSGPHQLRGQELFVSFAIPKTPQVRSRVPNWLQGHPPTQLTQPEIWARHHVAAPVQLVMAPFFGLKPGWQHLAAPMQLVMAPATGLTPGYLFLTRVAAAVTKEDLQGYFKQWGELRDVYVPPGKSIAFVSFIDANMALQIVAMPEHEVKTGCVVRVALAYDRPPLEAKKGKLGYPHSQLARPRLWARQRLEAPVQLVMAPFMETKPGCQFLTKVGADVTKEDLHAYFKQWGELKDVYVIPGKSIAFVSFSEAKMASPPWPDYRNH